ncbi:uncharacterized protein CANTADRAFT_23366 [Suhomyces tanzawaensis NRRL Y-17324]|uniref:Uncharacterized protein n=1 Tax=Suhomyces tanzawaensis NRRL Y-17324 TaxID=984487 RepID=A0A1E4SCN2_9ASCO|nr:uncharacterized protein CANTADRAFT_23366 [Suhomyces tanzawaensis NRRL Y-17324]ODV77226.1 hypothetical protein CANTADRAFT_23366 [Suhomyces tanzawaensis NRRL Y-17324]
MSQEFISDSEDENGMLLNTSMISPSRMAVALDHLAPEQRIRADDHLHQMGLAVRQPQQDVTNEFQELLNIAVLPSSDDEQPSGVTNPPTNQDDHENENEHENINNLRIYLDSRNYEHTSRRGLRKRNFASTHPYLADQAHYLGLSSINYLNELYNEKQDFEHIVKYLNYSYRKQKEANPKDEKYKAKNFYTILGRQTAVARAKEKEEVEAEQTPQESQGETLSQPSQFQNDLSENSSYELDDSTSNLTSFGRHQTPRISDEEWSGSESEIIDTRRTPLEKFSRKQKLLQYKEQRKGLAVKKNTGIPKHHNREVFDFVDDNVEQDADNLFYRRVDTSHDHMSDFDAPLRSVDTFGILSESSGSEAEQIHEYDSDDNSLFKQGSDTPRILEQIEVLLDGSVEEVDRINPMFASNFSSGRKSGSKRSKPKATPRKSQSKLSLGLSTPRSYSDKENRPLQTPKSISRTNTNSPSSMGGGQLQARLNLPSINGLAHQPQTPTVTSRKPKSKSRMSKSKGMMMPIGTLHKKKMSKANNKKYRKNGHRRNRLYPYTRPSTTNAPNKAQQENNKSEPADSLAPIPSHTKNDKDLLKLDYYFLRSPVQFTTVFEAESERNYVQERGFKRHQLESNHKMQESFPNGFILNEIDIKKIHLIMDGKTYLLKKDLVQLNYSGESFTFTMIDKEQSWKSCERLIVLLVKVLKDLSILAEQIRVDEIYSAIKGLIEWSLIVQEPPHSEKICKLINYCLNLLTPIKDLESGRNSVLVYSWLILLSFSLKTMQRKQVGLGQSSTNKELNIKETSEQYWILFFRFLKFPFSEGTHSKFEESFQIMRTIFNLEGHFWDSLTNVMDPISAEVEMDSIFDKILSLLFSGSCPVPGWSPLIKLYSLTDINDSSDSHIRFIDSIVELNQALQWPLDESILLKIYSSITSRRFSNLRNEWVVPEVLGRIRTRNDIPYDSFFERFMYLVYIYVSGLSSNVSKKKLITKLITSSHYQYQEGRAHYTMFINRLNLILLLIQISETDLKNQLLDLIQSAQDCKDTEIYEAMVLGLLLHTEINIGKKSKIAINCFDCSINGIVNNYLSIRSVQGLWSSLMEIFEMVTDQNTQYVIQFLEIYNKINENMTDKLSQPIHKVLMKGLKKLVGVESNFGLQELSTLARANDKIYSLLHKLMSRFPLPNINEEIKLDQLVELYFQIWLNSASLLPNTNWSRIALQFFPYLGNSKLREKFKLYFYSILIKFTSYKPFVDDIIIGLLRSLGSYSPSKYHSVLMNQLNEEKDEIVQYQKKYIPEDVTSFHLLNFRTRLVLNLLTNLSKAKIPEVTKRIFIEEFLKTLNDEFDKYFSSSWFKEYCVRCVKAIQKYCGDILPKNPLMRAFASKLSIPQSELDKYEWLSLPLKERLISLNKEVTNHIHYGKDNLAILKVYTFDEGVDLLYHLLSIYARSLEVNQIKWRYIYCLLDFFEIHLKTYKFSILNASFKKFLEMLTDVSNIRPGAINEIGRLYRVKSLESIVKILKFAHKLFDGYKDQEHIIDLVNAFMNGDDSGQIRYFSPFRLFDIQDLREDNVGEGLIQVEEEIVIEEEEVLRIMRDGLKLHEVPPKEESLDFSLCF